MPILALKWLDLSLKMANIVLKVYYTVNWTDVCQVIWSNVTSIEGAPNWSNICPVIWSENNWNYKTTNYFRINFEFW